MYAKTLAFIVLAMLSASVFAAQPRTVVIEGQDNMRFSVEKIVAEPGEKITIKLVNKTKLPAGAMSHNLVLLKNSADAKAFAQAAVAAKPNGYIPKNKTDLIIARTEMVAGGESDTVTFTVPKQPGTYTYICTFPGHYAAGMVGKLVVKG